MNNVITLVECKKLAALLGICWHEQKDSQTLECKHCGEGLLFPWQQNPNFLDPVVVLREMLKRPDLDNTNGFPNYLVDEDHGWWIDVETFCISIDLILDTTGKLALAALEWLRKEA